ncbi:unnamed protein product [Dicrocoelium dendriticum]|nr:unnamed protein product [Dicrocoelium dendriticum]CAH8514651.1 unnamed protein product [Dicrocoelium dendriticum]
MSKNTASVCADEEPSNLETQSKLLQKAAKKSKKRPKPETDDPNVPRPKSKKHKKQRPESCHTSCPQPVCTGVSSDVGRTPGENAPELKKKKSIRADAKQVDSNKGTEIQQSVKQRLEHKSKRVSHHQSRLEADTITAATCSAHEGPGLHAPDGFDLRESTMIPISPELQPISTYQSPEPEISPQLSVRSRCSSGTSHSSYSRSSPRHSSARRQHHEPESGRPFRSRRMEDPRPRFTYRAYAGYRRISHGRDSSPEEWSAEDFNSRHRRGRSRGSPRSGHGTIPHSYGYRYPDSRQRYDSSPRSSGQRRHESRRSRSRSPSSKRDRHHYELSDRSHPRTRHYPQRLSPNGYSRHRPIARRRSSREPAYDGSSQYKPSRDDPSRSSGTKRAVDDDKYHSYKQPSRRTGLTSEEERHKHDVEQSRSKSPAKESKDDKLRGRSVSDPEREHPGARRSPVRTTDNKRHKSPSSRSPRTVSGDKVRKPKISAKVSAVLDLLGEVTVEAVSDTELESILPPEILSVGIMNHTVTLSSVISSVETRPITSEDQNMAAYQGLVSAPEPEAKHVNTPDALDKLTSRIRQKLSEPEPWDSAELSSVDGDEVDTEHAPEEDAPALEHSLVNIAAINKNHSSLSQQAIASLSTQWQELIESAEKNLTSVGTETDFVSPSVRVTDILKPIQPDLQLVSFLLLLCTVTFPSFL